MTDLGESGGGELLFENAAHPGFTDLIKAEQAVQLLRESGDPNLAFLKKILGKKR